MKPTTSLLLPLLFALMSIALLFVSCRKQQNPKISDAVRQELLLHPQARVVDIYKNFFQDAFGPGHMINDTTAAMRYLLHELQKASDYDTVIIQALGTENNFYRVNLSLVKDSILPLEVLFYAFTHSASLADPPPMPEWVSFWNNTYKTIQAIKPDIPGAKEDYEFISLNLKNNDPVIHHSEEFKRLYHPHYRIVHKNYIDTILYYTQKHHSK